MVSKYITIILIKKAKTVTLQKRNLAENSLTKRSMLTLSVIGSNGSTDTLRTTQYHFGGISAKST